VGENTERRGRKLLKIWVAERGGGSSARPERGGSVPGDRIFISGLSKKGVRCRGCKSVRRLGQDVFGTQGKRSKKVKGGNWQLGKRGEKCVEGTPGANGTARRGEKMTRGNGGGAQLKWKQRSFSGRKEEGQNSTSSQLD